MDTKNWFDIVVGISNIIGALAAVIAVSRASEILKIIRSDTNHITGDQKIQTKGANAPASGRDVNDLSNKQTVKIQGSSNNVSGGAMND